MKKYKFSLKDEAMIEEVGYHPNFFDVDKEEIPVPKEYLKHFVDGEIYDGNYFEIIMDVDEEDRQEQLKSGNGNCIVRNYIRNMAENKYEGETWMYIFREYKPEITEKEVDYILWNETCFPFNDEATVKQIENYFNKLKQEKMYSFLIDPNKWVKVGELHLEPNVPYWFKKTNGQIVMGTPFSDGYSAGIANCYAEDGMLRIESDSFHVVRNGYVQPVLEKSEK